MATISLSIGNITLTAQLNDSPTARAIAALLPMKVRMSRWGDEYYGELPANLGMGESPDARTDMGVGELAWWPPGNALCIFFGPTPASHGGEPRAASPVNPIGTIRGDVATLKKLALSVTATLSA